MRCHRIRGLSPIILIDLKHWKRRSLTHRFKEWLARLVEYWL